MSHENKQIPSVQADYTDSRDERTDAQTSICKFCNQPYVVEDCPSRGIVTDYCFACYVAVYED